MWVDGKPPKDAQGRELVCELKRGLYGLKQSGHLWGECFKEFLMKDEKYNMGFTEMTGEPNLYRKTFVLNGKNEEILLGQMLMTVSLPQAVKKQDYGLWNDWRNVSQ
jgi:hypothetical protein